MGRQVDVALVVGHSVASPGSHCAHASEFYFWSHWVRSLAEPMRAQGLKVRVVRRDHRITGWTERQLDLVERLVAMGPRVVLDLHHNGGGYPGSYALHTPGDEDSRTWAVTCAKATAAATGTRCRGVGDSAGADGRPRSWTGKETESSDGKWYPAGSPLYLLETGITTAVLEPFDGSVRDDYEAGLAALRSGVYQAELAAAVAEYLA